MNTCVLEGSSYIHHYVSLASFPAVDVDSLVHSTVESADLYTKTYTFRGYILSQATFTAVTVTLRR